jgi:acyl-CoA synthetase (NDP forming)
MALNNAIRMTPENWQHLFSPASVAVIGASNTPGSWGNNAVKGLLNTGGRRIHPVNPKATEILGLKAYGSVLDIPDSIELAVIVVTAKLVPQVLGQCVAKGTKAAVIISSGFGETGEEGRQLEAELSRIARRGGLRFIGPNSMGHADTRSQLSTFGQVGKMPMGEVAVLSQSGNMCLKIVRSLAEAGVAFSKYISTGNEVDLHMEDYLEYLADDDDTRIIAAYIEGLRDGRRFLQVARKITAKKPLIVIKVGGTRESARAVMSHTGVLAGADAVYTAAFRQTGIIRVDDDDELTDTLLALLDGPLPKSNRVGILSVGGGPGALTAEACEKEGLTIGTLEESTLQKLDKYLPPRWPRRNPVDMAGPSASEFATITELLLALLEDANIDAVLMLAPIVMDQTMLAGRMGFNAGQIKAYREKERKNLRVISEKAQKYGKPVFLMWQWRGMNTSPQTLRLLHREGIVAQSNARRAARVLCHLAWYRQYLARTTGK